MLDNQPNMTYTLPMSLRLQPAPFGTPIRTQILVFTALLGEAYPSQLARIIGASRSAVGAAVDSLERDRLLATRRWGMERRISLNPSTPFSAELRALLLKIAQSSPEYEDSIASLRMRPRRRGKPLAPSQADQADLARELAARQP